MWANEEEWINFPHQTKAISSIKRMVINSHGDAFSVAGHRCRGMVDPTKQRKDSIGLGFSLPSFMRLNKQTLSENNNSSEISEFLL